MADNPSQTVSPVSGSVLAQDSKPLCGCLDDIAEIEKVFNRFDANGDGKISVSELDLILKTLGSEVSSVELQQVMKELDTDCDGFINLDEFAAFCRASSPTDDSGTAELRDAFNLYDKDGNGLISCSELHLVLNRLGMSCSTEDCKRMIRSVDSDGDCCVNFEEFKKMMMTNTNNGAKP